MALSKGIKAQEGIPICITKWLPGNKSGLNLIDQKTSKIIPKMSRSALPRDYVCRHGIIGAEYALYEGIAPRNAFDFRGAFIVGIRTMQYQRQISQQTNLQ